MLPAVNFEGLSKHALSWRSPGSAFLSPKNDKSNWQWYDFSPFREVPEPPHNPTVPIYEQSVSVPHWRVSENKFPGLETLQYLPLHRSFFCRDLPRFPKTSRAFSRIPEAFPLFEQNFPFRSRIEGTPKRNASAKTIRA